MLLIAHAYLVSEKALDELDQRHTKGQTPGGALASLQCREARLKRKTCFYLKPDLVTQKEEKSLTCVESSWVKGLKTTAKKVYPTSLRGSKPISKKALQNMRSRTGEKGGQVNAGSEVKAMTKHTEAYGKWPSNSVSLARWSVSSKLWARARRQHFQT